MVAKEYIVLMAIAFTMVAHPRNSLELLLILVWKTHHTNLHIHPIIAPFFAGRPYYIRRRVDFSIILIVLAHWDDVVAEASIGPGSEVDSEMNGEELVLSQK